MTMKNVRALFTVLIILLFTFGIATAQGRNDERSPEDRLQNMLDDLTERLELTDEQIPKVKTVLEDQQDRLEILKESARNRGPKGLEELREEFDKIQKETEGHLEDILTKDQMKEYRKIKEERQEENRDRMGDRPGGPGGPGGGGGRRGGF